MIIFYNSEGKFAALAWHEEINECLKSRDLATMLMEEEMEED